MKSVKKGFTLIELLVVIAIIAILAAILFPVFAQVRNKARQTTGELNIRQISYGILQYMQDNEEKGPREGYSCLDSATDPTAFAPGEANQCGGDNWQNVVAPYIKSKAIYLSPGDQSAVGQGAWGGGMGNDLTPDDGNLSLMYNDLLSHKMLTKSGSTADPGYTDPSTQTLASDGRPLSDIKDPTQCLLISEGHSGWNKCSPSGVQGKLAATVVVTDWTGSTDLLNRWHHEYTVSGNVSCFMSATAYNGTAMVRIGLPFYNGGGNVAFVDGHQQFKLYSSQSGLPGLCKSLPWVQSEDPEQVGLGYPGHDSCTDPNNLPGVTNGGWTIPNWF
jgi:prepilin-type N-terminal cleavage/methylation domain-containing protein/prepilin-type processing-associated H-X9-DG protein